MVNQRHEDCTLEGAKGKKKALSPIVMYSAKCFERLVSICVIDICLDQLTEEQPVSVVKTLTNIKSQLFLQLISSDEEEFVKKTLQHIQRSFVWRKGEDNNSGLEIKSFRNRVRKYCLLFKRKSVGWVFSVETAVKTRYFCDSVYRHVGWLCGADRCA